MKIGSQRRGAVTSDAPTQQVPPLVVVVDTKQITDLPQVILVGSQGHRRRSGRQLLDAVAREIMAFPKDRLEIIRLERSYGRSHDMMVPKALLPGKDVLIQQVQIGGIALAANPF